MRKSMVFIFVFLSVFFGVGGSCNKDNGGGGGGGGGTTEANLVVILNPPVNSTQPAAPQVDFPLTVTINSTMPSQGVTIDVSAKKDDGSADPAFFSTTLNSTTALNNFSITSTPTGVMCITTVKVTSKTTATNTWTGTYRYSRKP